MPLLQLHFLDSGGHRELPAKVAAHKSLLAVTKKMTIKNLRPDHAKELRWLFHAGSKLPGKIGTDVVDISDARDQGICFVKYVHYTDPQTQILKDVITLELRRFALALTTYMPVGSSWLPPTLKSKNEPASARPTHTADSDGEDSGRFSHMSLNIKKHKEAVAKMAAEAAPTPAIPAPVPVATAPRQQEESWSQQKRKRNKATRQSMHNTSNSQFLSQGLYAQTQGPGNPMDCYPTGITHVAPNHRAWASPLAHLPPAPAQPAFAAAPGTTVPPLAGILPQLPAGSGYESNRSGPSNASSLTNRSTRTIEECEHLIGQLEAAVAKSTRDKAESESARVAAVMDRDALKQALGANEALLKATQASVEALSLSNKTTEVRLAAMESLMVQFAMQSAVVGPSLHSGAQINQPPQIQRTGAEHQELLEDDDEDNPMFTPKCSKEHKATVAAGPDGRHVLSPPWNLLTK